MKSSAHSSRSDGRKRYSAAVEKGENAWRREWGSFISNLTLKRVQDGYGSVTLRAGADLKRQAILERRALRYAADDSTAGTSQAVEDGSAAAQGGTPADASSHVGGKTEAAEEEVRGAMAATYSYLFNSPSERKAARAARQHTRQRARPGRTGGAHPDSDDEDEDGMGGPDAPTRLSKHQKALLEADRCGLVLHDMTRREKRDFLKLSVTRDQQAAQEWSKTLKLHELMDPKAAWYQQGPHPIDLIAEKLVRHKAVKRGKQLGLRYNYYLPHPSWLARRAQHRRESLLVGLGRRFVFDENGVMCDALRQTPVDPLHPRLLLVEDNAPVTAATSASESASPPAPPPSTSEQAAAAATESAQTVCAATTRALPDSSLLRDPRAMANSYVRAVVRNAEVAQSFHRANLTTNYLSPALVAGPNMHPQDAMLASAAAAAAPLTRSVERTTAPSVLPAPRSASSPAATRPARARADTLTPSPHRVGATDSLARRRADAGARTRSKKTTMRKRATDDTAPSSSSAAAAAVESRMKAKKKSAHVARRPTSKAVKSNLH